MPMKNLLVFCIISLVFTGCGSKELSQEEAFRTLKKEMNFPKVYDYEIYCSDPQHASRAIEAGLESNGFVTIKSSQKLKDSGSTLITFTDKAKSFLLPTPEEDKAIDVQKVKVADENLIEVTGIKSGDDGKSAVVEYMKGYTNITPFATLVHKDLKKPTKHTAYFSLYDDRWRLDKARKDISRN